MPPVSSKRYLIIPTQSPLPNANAARSVSDKKENESRPPMDPALTSPGRLAAIDTSRSSDRLAPWSDGDAALSSKSHCVSTPCAVSAATAACVCMVRCEFMRDLLRVLHLCQLEVASWRMVEVIPLMDGESQGSPGLPTPASSSSCPSGWAPSQHARRCARSPVA